MSIMTPRKDGDLLFVGGEGGNGVMIKLADRQAGREGAVAREEGRTSIYPINMTPFVEDGHMYGVDQTGQLRCVKMETGERLWESAAPFDDKPTQTGTAFIVKNGDRFFLFTRRAT